MTADADDTHPAYQAVADRVNAMFPFPPRERSTAYTETAGYAIMAVMEMHSPRHYEDAALGIESWSCEECFHRRGGYPCPTVQEIIDALGVKYDG